MAYSYGRQFRRIAAEAITADRAEMDALIARILPPRDDGTPRVLQVKTADERKRAPAAIVAAFFADAISGDEGAALLRQTEDPAFHKPPQREWTDYAMYGPVCLTPGWRNPVTGLPYSPPPAETDFQVWGPPLSHDPKQAARNAEAFAAAVVNYKENTSSAGEGYEWRSVETGRPRRNIWDAPPQIRVRIDTGAPADSEAAEPAPDPPP